ncbi:hypothetical protein [Desulforegula conservatrix]|uniref:hypothetical protein n=1 Tax=Desulforegula conservatrix TaxID=153026 RepID=UPI00041D279D|nr:hypothetical protein [Desulforegula conservatrix]
MITVYIENDFGKDRYIEVYDVLAHNICMGKRFAPHEKIPCQIQCNQKNRGEIMIRSASKPAAQEKRPRWYAYAWLSDQTRINYTAP